MSGRSRKTRWVWVSLVALLAVTIPLGIYGYYHGPKLIPIVPEPIVPPQSVRIDPPFDSQGPYHSGGPDSVWDIETFSLPDSDPDDVVQFYEDQGFTCHEESYTIGVANRSITAHWSCGWHIRAAEVFTVSIAESLEGEGSIVQTKTIVWAFAS